MRLRDRIRNARCPTCHQYIIPKWIFVIVCVVAVLTVFPFVEALWQSGYDSGHYDGWWDGYNEYNPYYRSADFYLYSCKHHLNENYTSFYLLSTARINGGPFDTIVVDQNYDGAIDGYCTYTATIPYRVIFP